MTGSNSMESKMNVGSLLGKLLPYVLPYKWLLIATLTLTLVGSLMAQVNAVVLDKGHVEQHGTPTEVYHQGGLYKDIFDAAARSMNADMIASTMNGKA